MRWQLYGCGRYRADLCLLASGALGNQERDAIERHLATCADCQNYYEHVRRLTAPLAEWEKAFSHVEANQAAQARWAKVLTGPLEEVRGARILDWQGAMFWPCRRIWTGFAAVWLAILAFNFSIRDRAQTPTMKSSRPSVEMIRTYLEGEGFLAEWARRDKNREAEPPKPPVSAPRSERAAQVLRV
jgi:anti-sigma factor RsiW